MSDDTQDLLGWLVFLMVDLLTADGKDTETFCELDLLAARIVSETHLRLWSSQGAEE